MTGEAPDPREQEDCPGIEYCFGKCDQHEAEAQRLAAKYDGWEPWEEATWD